MSHKSTSVPICILLAAIVLSASGCGQVIVGPNLGLLAYPIPISPYFQKKEEDAYWNHKRYDRAPVLGPIQPGAPCFAIDTPSEDEVMRRLEKARPVQGGIAFLHEVQRNNVKITVEPIADYVDPPRFYPTIGPAQLHHAHFKCTIFYKERTCVGWPVPYTTTDEDCQEVIYIDHDHLHQVGNVDPGPGSAYPGPRQM